jgi:hypothetical protein
VKRLALVLAAATVLATAGPAAAEAGPLTVTTSVFPRWLYFADTITARVDVRFDPHRVAAGSIRVEPSFAPWEQVAPIGSSTEVGDSIGHRTFTFTLACIAIDCVPRGTAAQRFHLPKASVTAKTETGSSVVVRRSWPGLRIAGRFSPAHTVGLRPVFQLNTALPSATYRVSPDLLALALDVIGGLVVALALGLGAVEAAKWLATRRLTVDATPPLVRALALLRQSQQRDEEDRRRAASLVARTLSPESDGLMSTATEVAWSPAEPTPDRLEELAQAVEGRLEGSS